jgi:hypothetical protein
VHARYPLIEPVYTICRCTVRVRVRMATHDERRRAIKSHEWRLSDAAGACVGACTLPNDQVHVVCRCSMRVRVQRAHARRAAPCNQIARMAPQRRRWGTCGCTHATQRPSTYHLSMHRACTSAEGPRTTSGAVQANRNVPPQRCTAPMASALRGPTAAKRRRLPPRSEPPRQRPRRTASTTRTPLAAAPDCAPPAPIRR